MSWTPFSSRLEWAERQKWTSVQWLSTYILLFDFYSGVVKPRPSLVDRLIGSPPSPIRAMWSVAHERCSHWLELVIRRVKPQTTPWTPRICSGKDAGENETRRSIIAFCHAAAQKNRGVTAAQACKGTGSMSTVRPVCIYLLVYICLFYSRGK